MLLIVIEIETSVERNLIEQGLHVPKRCNGNADLPHLPGRERMIGIQAHLRGEIKSDAQSRLPLIEQIAVALV